MHLLYADVATDERPMKGNHVRMRKIAERPMFNVSYMLA